jgi:uncharacterized protein (TIGR03437 family)
MRLFLAALLATSAAAQGVITTIAGTDAIFADDGKPATSAALVGPTGLALDSAGNLFIASPPLNMVFEVDTKGTITIVAGNGLNNFAGDGGPARAASLSGPTAVAVDGAGNVYILDTGNVRVRRVSPNGIIQTVAGNGNDGFSGDGGPATKASFSLLAFGGSRPNGIAVDGAGNLFIADRYNNRIRKVNSTGIISTIAGNGNSADSGNGGPATQAGIIQPSGIRLDAAGNLYIAEPFGQVRKIAPNGTITGFPTANGAAGLTADSAGSIYYANQSGERIQKIVGTSVIPVAGNGRAGFSGDGGAATGATLASPSDIVLDGSGNFYVADRDNDRIRKIDPNGGITTYAGAGAGVGDGQSAATARLDQPSQMALDSAGNLYVADADNQRVRKISPNGTITTFAGNGRAGSAGDDGPATAASLNTPLDVKVDPAGNVYIVNAEDGRVRRVSTSGVITTVAGGGATRTDNVAATSTFLSYPISIALDSAGNLYVSEVDYGSIRKIDANGIITPFAGNGNRGYSGDGGPATAATLSGGTNAMVCDSAGNLYFTDGDNFRVRKIDSKGIITTFAGGGPNPMNGADLNSYDGKPATSAFLLSPKGLAFDRAGNLYINTTGRVWYVKPDGTIHAYAGAIPSDSTSINDIVGFSGDGGSATAARFGDPNGAAIDSAGNLYMADRLNRRIRLIQNGPGPSIIASQKGLTFIASTSGAAPASQSFTIVNGGQGTLNWSVSTSTTSGSNWLSITPATGASAAGVAGPPVQVTISPSGLAAGDYYGQIQIQAPGAPNSPQSVTVVLTVRAPGTGTGSTVQPSGLLFTNATPEALTLTTLSTTPVSFTGTASFGGPTWFTLSPASGTVVAGQPATVKISPVIAGLANSVYNGNITFAFSDNSLQNVQLLLVLSGGANLPAAPGPRPVGCAPSKLLPLFTSLGGGFNLTTGWPAPVELLVYDDCGTPLIRGTVTANFSNTDPALPLNSLGDGRWTGTWIAQNLASSVNVTANAQAIDKSLTGSTQITGGLTRNANPPPVVAPGGVLNAASYQLQGSLAPGTLVSIFGSLLAQGAVSAPALPLTNSLAGTSVTIAGRTLPLLYAGPNQVNAMIPYDLPINATQQVVVQRGTAVSIPQPIGVLSSQSGVFTKDLSGQGAGIIVRVTADGTQSIVTPDNPTQAYEVLVIYCAGLGDVNPRQVAGQQVTVSPLSQTIDAVTVTIGGLDAPVAFAGLTPGFTGLYQVNAYVPVGVAPGDNVPLIITQAGRSSPPVSISVR